MEENRDIEFVQERTSYRNLRRQKKGLNRKDKNSFINQIVLALLQLTLLRYFLKNDFYVKSASGRKISLFNMMTFKTMTIFMFAPPAATFLAFHPQDNNVIAIGVDDSSIQIYNVRVDK
ncbi:hypothetical protein H5410_041368, partial [Solanum commersonii]